MFVYRTLSTLRKFCSLAGTTRQAKWAVFIYIFFLVFQKFNLQNVASNHVRAKSFSFFKITTKPDMMTNHFRAFAFIQIGDLNPTFSSIFLQFVYQTDYIFVTHTPT
jgi:hypothetical protein